jgi:hypothetical protein
MPVVETASCDAKSVDGAADVAAPDPWVGRGGGW